MQSIANIINSSVLKMNLDSSAIESVEGCVTKELKVDGWITVELCNKECLVLKFDNGVYVNEGYLLNEEKVERVFGNDKYDSSLLNMGIADLDHGTRFEGTLLNGIPYGYGELYDDSGCHIYDGVVINWKRFGYGVSFHNNGYKEYEGYWCDDKEFGIGMFFDRKQRKILECDWYNGQNGDDYEGDGTSMPIGLKRMKLCDRCTWSDFDLSLFVFLETIEIGEECFAKVNTFKIDGLKHLRSVKIGDNSFTLVNEENWDDDWECDDENSGVSRSFHILNCENLESIEVGGFSFSTYDGQFELKNLPSLRSVNIGLFRRKSCNFRYSSFVIQGNWLSLSCIVDLPSLESISLGDDAFRDSFSTVIQSAELEWCFTLRLTFIANNNAWLWCFVGEEWFSLFFNYAQYCMPLSLDRIRSASFILTFFKRI